MDTSSVRCSQGVNLPLSASAKKQQCEYVTRNGKGLKCPQNATNGPFCKRHAASRLPPQIPTQPSRIIELPPTPPQLQSSTDQLNFIQSNILQQPVPQQQTVFQLTPEQMAASERLRMQLLEVSEGSEETVPTQPPPPQSYPSHPQYQRPQPIQEPQYQEEEVEEEFDPQSYRSEAIDMALQVDKPVAMYTSQEGLLAAQKARRDIMSRGYYTVFGAIEVIGTMYGVNRLHGMTSNLQQNESITEIMPYAMDEAAQRLGIKEEMSPMTSLLVATAMTVATTLLVNPGATEKSSTGKIELPEVVPEEIIGDEKKAPEDGYLDDRFPE